MRVKYGQCSELRQHQPLILLLRQSYRLSRLPWLKSARPISSFRMQQAFLRITIDALMTQLYWAQWTQEPARTSTIRTQCATVASLQRWHRQSRQRCVNAVAAWNDERQAVVWQLTVGAPLY